MSDYIPPELIPNILSRLPVDDVLRVRVSANHAKESDGMKVHWKVHLDNQTFDEIGELQCPVGRTFKIIGSINGLLCLSYYMSFRMRIILWNPSLRKSFTLPDCGSNRFGDVSFGFGFLPETNDYKVARLLISHRNTEVVIYELSTKSWRNVSVGQVSCIASSYHLAVFLNGILHWGVRIYRDDESDEFGKSIVSFDLRNENLGALSVPKCLDNNASQFIISVVEKSLCLIDFAGHDHHDIWVMNEYGVPDSWTMKFRIEKGDYSLAGPLNFTENGEIILKEKESIFTKDHLVSYDLTTDQVRNIGNYENSFMRGVTTYMESLVLIKSTNQVV